MIKYNTIQLTDLFTTSSISNSHKVCLFNSEASGNVFLAVTSNSKIYKIYIDSAHTETHIEISFTLTGFVSETLEFLGITRNTETSYYILVNDNGVKCIADFNPETNLLNKVCEIPADKIEGTSKLLSGIALYVSNNVFVGNINTNSNLMRISTRTGNMLARMLPQGISEIIDIKYDGSNVWMLGKSLKKDSTYASCLFIWDSTYKLMNIVDLPTGSYTSFEINNGTLWLFGLNFVKVFTKTSTVKLISSVYFVRHAILKIIKGGKILWSILSGCFSTGFWMEEEFWKNDETWKDN